MNNGTSSILLVEDHPVMRDGLATQIRNEPDLQVCGEAEDVHEALRLVQQLHPDLVIVDICLKSGHGIDLVRRVHDSDPKQRMLVNSMYDEASMLSAPCKPVRWATSASNRLSVRSFQPSEPYLQERPT